MPGDRTRKITIKVQRALGDLNGIGSAQSDRVWDVLNIIQDRICEEAMSLQDKSTITLVSGTELYAPPDGFLGEITMQLPTAGELQRLRMDQVSKLKNSGTSLDNTTGNAIYFYEWANKIGFLNGAGGAPSTGGDITIWFWRKRKSDGTEDLSASIDPIVNQRWDNCLYLGGVAMIRQNPQDVVFYESEFNRQKNLEDAARDVRYRVPVSSEFD